MRAVEGDRGRESDEFGGKGRGKIERDDQSVPLEQSLSQSAEETYQTPSMTSLKHKKEIQYGIEKKNFGTKDSPLWLLDSISVGLRITERLDIDLVSLVDLSLRRWQ